MRASIRRSKSAPRSTTSSPRPHPTATLPERNGGLINMASIHALQRTIGNQAVMRLISRTPVAPHIQRKPSGLKMPKTTNEFVADALNFWSDPAKKDQPLQDYSDFLITKVNLILQALPTYQVKKAYDTAGASSGGFNRTDWTMTMNPKKFAMLRRTTKIGELSADEAAAVADTVYHEARHAEQNYKMAQVLAGEKQKPTAIAASLNIPPEVADDAYKNPITPDRANQDMVDEVRDWQKFTVGAYMNYKQLVTVFSSNGDLELLRKIAAMATAEMGMEDMVSVFDHQMKEWEANKLKEFETELKRVKALTTKTSQDTEIEGHLTLIVDKFKEAIKAWKADTVRDEKSIRTHMAPLKALYDAAYAAYRALPHEKDAWETGVAVSTEFKSQAKKKKVKKSPARTP